jgi:hypothetical protein
MDHYEFSVFHPISFSWVLPFQSQELVTDDPRLIGADEAHLAETIILRNFKSFQ